MLRIRKEGARQEDIRREKKRRRRRKGVSLVEAVIVIVVLTLSIWAILSTASWSTEVQIMTRRGLGARTLASSWFEVFESIDPGSGFSMANAAQTVANILSPGALGNPVSGYVIDGYLVTAVEEQVADGVRTVDLTVNLGQGRTPFVFRKRVNSRSSDTVSDDR